MKFLFISGTNSSPCRFEADFEFLKDQLEKMGHEIAWWSVHDNPIPYLNPKNYPSNQASGLEEKIKQSDAIIIASPVYHASISGALKNTLDHVDYKIFTGKKVGLLCNAASPYGTGALFSHLRDIITEMRGVCVPAYVGTVKDDYTKHDDGSYHLENDAIKKRLMVMTQQLEKVVIEDGFES